ncbi:hypothetical protein ACFQ08_23570 [Streptosporangium algeriense]|uniref:Uncharacterized protein n=1 Tax=Streptosporangium algeriense TaxID=1682748 RepID=A0ABW3DWW7_9ACTN
MCGPVASEYGCYRAGMLTRDPRAFGAMEDGSPRAHTHPDTPDEEFDLMTDRYEGVKT